MDFAGDRGGSRVGSEFVGQQLTQFLGRTSRQGRRPRSPGTATGSKHRRRVRGYETRLRRRGSMTLRVRMAFWGQRLCLESRRMTNRSIFEYVPHVGLTELGW